MDILPDRPTGGHDGARHVISESLAFVARLADLGAWGMREADTRVFHQTQAIFLTWLRID